MLSTAEIEAMADVVTESLPEPMTILRESAGAEDTWGHKARSNPTEVEIQGYYHELRGDELTGPLINGAVVATAEIRLPAGTAINERDQIRRADGTVVDVDYVRDPTGYGLLLEAGVFSAKPVTAAG